MDSPRDRAQTVRMRTLLAVRGAFAVTLLLAACSTPSPTATHAAAAGKRWFKGNLHTHSLWSDGNDFPEVVSRWYKDHGYDFMALSDHNVLAEGEKWIKVDDVVRRGGRTGLQRYKEQFGDDWVETREREGKLEVRLRRLEEYRPLLEEAGKFLLIQAEEVTDRFEQRPIHMNATNVAERIEPQHGGSVQEVMRNNLRAVQEQSERLGVPIVMHLNHPNFGWAITAEDLAAVTEERFFEVYNGHPDVHQLGDEEHVSIERMWDIANTLRIAAGAPPLFGLGVDDSHNYFNASGSTPGRGWVMVHASGLSADAITAALDAGDFYASSGVALREVRFENGELAIDIEAQRGVQYRTVFLGTRRGFDAASTPVMGEDGEVPNVTRRYSEQVGAALAVVSGPKPRYRWKGDELYVRAVVTADVPPENPVWEGQRQQAWTQPFGWR